MKLDKAKDVEELVQRIKRNEGSLSALKGAGQNGVDVKAIGSFYNEVAEAMIKAGVRQLEINKEDLIAELSLL